MSLASFSLSRSSSPLFAKLEHLRLEDCDLFVSSSRPWLQHVNFPALRIVDLVDFVGARLSSRPTLDHLFDFDMLNQLDYVYVQAMPLAPSSKTDLARCAPPIFLYLWDDDSGRLPPFSLFLSPSVDNSSTPATSVSKAAAWLGARATVSTVSTPTIVLSAVVRTFAAEHDDVAAALSAFETQCAAKGVRLVWVKERGSLAEPFAMPEVQQLARELRAARAQA